ncbi:MAG: metallophosphoesterase [Planctomycetota bacterium]
MLIRVIGDPHGVIDPVLDEPAYRAADVRMCTGDFGYHVQGAERRRAVEVMTWLRQLGALTILGNHDGINHRPSLVYGPAEAEPAAQEEIETALGPCHLGYARHDLQGLSIVGGRPYSNGNPGIQHPPAGREKITVEESAALITDLMLSAPNEALLVLTHNGPRGLGAGADAPCGKDWRPPHDDWGDEDLGLALQRIPSGKRVVAVVAGHMHHTIRGGGFRRRVGRFQGIPVVNAAIVPRALPKGVVLARGESATVEKKILQPHRHFLELELDANQNLVRAGDFWARQGGAGREGVYLPLLGNDLQ